ncbi:hypothetical protein CCACVL1_03203 [Corchorus capsularis]|uniref:Uncharacterized protein n=1 Tax=Corchorus capsularis TaxID=210143 RepID=A0A1R3K1P4_COCAP|nr:hypothetical protein CCACVL1_03203 [Corchorus capsularis]
MAIDSTAPRHEEFKVLVAIGKPRGIDRDTAVTAPPFPMLKLKCNIQINYVPDTTGGSDTNIPATITNHDSWGFFHLPLDVFTSDDNFSCHSPQSYIEHMSSLMKIPFELDNLFLRNSSRDGDSVPLKSPDKIVTQIADTVQVMADEVGVCGQEGNKVQVLIVIIEKKVTLPVKDYLKMLKEKQQQDLFCDKILGTRGRLFLSYVM